MNEINIFCFGFGQVARNFIKKIDLENIKINLTSTSREKSYEKKINGLTYESLQFNENNFDKKIIERLEEADHILISIPPINGEDIVVKNFKLKIEKIKPKWITYLSATSVYGDHKGKWVNEEDETKFIGDLMPVDFDPQDVERRIKAEIVNTFADSQTQVKLEMLTSIDGLNTKLSTDMVALNAKVDAIKGAQDINDEYVKQTVEGDIKMIWDMLCVN